MNQFSTYFFTRMSFWPSKNQAEIFWRKNYLPMNLTKSVYVILIQFLNEFHKYISNHLQVRTNWACLVPNFFWTFENITVSPQSTIKYFAFKVVLSSENTDDPNFSRSYDRSVRTILVFRWNEPSDWVKMRCFTIVKDESEFI